MPGKITIISPPDFYENSNASILFVHITNKEQEIVGKWLSQYHFEENINFYIYNGEPNIPWLLWAAGRCTHKYINLDKTNEITAALGGYLLGKHGFYYGISDKNIAAVYNYINVGRLEKIEDFLKLALDQQS